MTWPTFKKEWHSVPGTNKKPIVTSLRSVSDAMSSEHTSFDEVYPFMGLMCCVGSLYTAHPDWIGCASRHTCCCLRGEAIMCKPGRTDDSHCTLFDTKLDITDFKLLLKVCLSTVAMTFADHLRQSQSQVLCTDVRCVLPPDDKDVPCLGTVCFWTVSHPTVLVSLLTLWSVLRQESLHL